MPFGMQVGLEPVNIVLDDDPPSSPTRDTAPIFGPRLLWQMAGWIKIPLGTNVGLGPCHTVLDWDPAPPAAKKGAQQPHVLAHVYCSQTVAYLSNS